MATVEVHYNVQQMCFELLTHARNRWTGANIGDARYRFVAQPRHFYRIDPFLTGETRRRSGKFKPFWKTHGSA
ncbi:hypothetical protein MJ390_04810 [Klebsiella pneumoniae]|nr:hypothetical protein MJ390_04810 [Klebsiella pneumoniae]